jgi:hypothetical protein
MSEIGARIIVVDSAHWPRHFVVGLESSMRHERIRIRDLANSPVSAAAICADLTAKRRGYSEGNLGSHMSIVCKIFEWRVDGSQPASRWLYLRIFGGVRIFVGLWERRLRPILDTSLKHRIIFRT